MSNLADETAAPPVPARATSLWEFQADEAIVAFDLDRRSGSVLVVDKGGSLHLLDVSGTLRAKHEIGAPPQSVAWSRGGFWAVSTEKTLHTFDLRGRPKGEHEKDPDHSLLSAGPRGLLATASTSGAVHLIGPDGNRFAEAHINNELLDVGYCSRDGSVVVTGAYGELFLIDVLGETCWKSKLKAHTVGLAASLVGWFVVGTYNDGAYGLDDRGQSLGNFASGTTLTTCALSPEASHLCLQGSDGMLYYLDFRTGMCLWRKKLSPRPTMIRVGRRGERVVTATTGGSIECFDFSPQTEEVGQRGDFLELGSFEETPVAQSVWKQPDAALRTSGSFAVAQSGSFLAVGNGDIVEILGKNGRRIRSIRSPLHPRELSVGLDDETVFVRSYQGGATLHVETGQTQSFVDPIDTIVPSRGDRFVALIGDGALGAYQLALFETGRQQWKVTLASTATGLSASHDLSLILVPCQNDEFYCLDGSGAILWHRPMEPLSGPPLVSGANVYVPEGPTEFGCYDAEGRLVWTAFADRPLSLFALGDEVYGRQEDNVFLRFTPEGRLDAVDRSENSGHSHLARTEAGAIVEVNIDGHTVTCFDLEGSILWRFEADGDISPSQVSASGGLLAVRSRSSVYLLNIGERAGEAGRSRGSFIEI